jgi:hypothetical protein
MPARNPGRSSTTLPCPAVTDLWDDYAVGERIDHVDGMTIEESEHMMATRLYQNTAKVHFNQQAERADASAAASSMAATSSAWRARCRSTAWPMPSASRRSTAAGMSRQPSPAIRSTPGRKSSNRCPAWRNDLGALRVRTVATKDQPCADFPTRPPTALRSERAPRLRLYGADAEKTGERSFCRQASDLYRGGGITASGSASAAPSSTGLAKRLRATSAA